MSKAIHQHYVPRVYLKNFQIDTGLNKSFVWAIDFSNKYNSKPQRLGLNDKVFKIKKYYHDKRINNPFAIEESFARYFEPKYPAIINAIETEIAPQKEIVEDIMIWLYISKMRSPYLRDTSEQFIDWYIRVTNGYKKHTPDEAEQNWINKYTRNTSKNIHLDAFLGNASELVNTYISTLNAKHWCILKSLPSFPFWTNDNPGFSPNLHPVLSKNDPFHYLMELNADSIIYYVLSPKYCLQIMPFTIGTPLDQCALNMEIKFEQASPVLIDYINMGVFYTRYKLVISNSLELLNSCIKLKKDGKL